MKRENGFTFIEITLVLAIAGFIFTMAFIALPGLWASERDAERRDNVLTFVTKLKDYMTNNNRGALPSDWNAFKTQFLPSNFTDPDGGAYTLSVKKCRSDSNIDYACVADATSGINDAGGINHILYVVTGAVCDGDSPKSSANPRRVAVLYKMERSNPYCANT